MRKMVTMIVMVVIVMMDNDDHDHDHDHDHDNDDDDDDPNPTPTPAPASPFIVQQPYAKFRMKPQMASVAVLVPVMFAIFGPTCHKTVEPIHIYICIHMYIYILIWDPMYHFTSTERGQHSGGGKVCNHKFWCLESLEKLFEFICTICLRNNVLLCFYHRSSKSTTVPDM